MVARNVFALCALVLLAFVACSSAMPERMTEDNAELGIIDDVVEYIKEKLKATKECIEEALATCEEQYPNKPISRAKCILVYVLDQQGSCLEIQPRH